MKKKFAMGLITAMMLTGAAVVPAETASAKSLQEMQEEKNALQNESGQINNEIENRDSTMQNLQQQRAVLEDEVVQIQMGIDDLMEKIGSQENALTELNAEIERLQQEIEQLKVQIAQREEKLKHQARAVQTQGNTTSMINIIIEAEDLSDLIGRLGVVTQLVGANKTIVEAQVADQQALEQNEAQIKEEKATAEAVKKELESNQAQLVVQKRDLDSKIMEVAEMYQLNAEEKEAFVKEQRLIAQRTSALNREIQTEENRIAEEKAREEAARREAERAAAEQAAREAAEKEAAEKAAAERAAAEKAAAEKAAAEQAAKAPKQTSRTQTQNNRSNTQNNRSNTQNNNSAAEKAAAERAAAEKAAAERAAAEKAAAEKAAAERAAAERAAAERAAAERAAAEKAAAEKAAQESRPSSGFVRPSNGYVTSRYGYRIHPIFGGRRLHAGMDFGGGGPIVAAQSGTVTRASYNSWWGYHVIINHGGGLQTVYAHMTPGLQVSAGQAVSRGQRLGTMGSTGDSTGVHLHFEVHRNGSAVDPAPYIGL